MNSTQSHSRRLFLRRLTLGTAALPCLEFVPQHLCAAPNRRPIAFFSKVCQEAKLNLEGTAEVAARAGLDGIDCPVRPGGQILPERAADDLPRMSELLAKSGRKVLLLTTAIQRVDSPHAESILRAAAKVGVKYYRLGYWTYQANKPVRDQLNDIKAQLKELAALNKLTGTCAILQNHAGANLVGAKVWDLYEVAREFDPEQVAIAFDLGHAIHELDQNWRSEFTKLRSHFRVAYVKDWKRGADFVKFGEGEIGSSGFFKLLEEEKSNAPLSMHTEYEWVPKGQPKTKEALVTTLRDDLRVLKGWVAAA